ncbi:MAG: M28 family peptidase [Thermomicrobiales bacterium]
MPGPVASEIEQALRQAVSPERLQQHLRVFAELQRQSGSDDERQAARYVVDTMRGYGIDAEILEFDSLISWPLASTLMVFDGSGESWKILVRTRSFGAQTPSGGIEAELVFVPFAVPRRGEMIFAHRAAEGDYGGLDVAGKVVLTADGGPDGVRRAQERGAAGHVHVWPSDEAVIHEMIASSVWGTPTPESARELPHISVLGIGHADGERLARRLEEGPLRARIEANVETAWRRLPLAVANIPGAGSPDFLLIGAHIDSWYEGVTDNATGDAALLEMARVLAENASHLRCGVRFAWWPGHSTGRYSGSTWYADTHFRALRDHALGYLNIDSPGVRGAEVWDCRYNTGEVEHIAPAVVRELSGQEPGIGRPVRAADQSFLGIGLPSLGAFRMLPEDHPNRKIVGGSAGAYWWHSPEDTLDKADAGVLAGDVEVYLTIVARLCAPEIVPYNFVPAGQDFIDELQSLQDAVGDRLDLESPLQSARSFRDAAERLEVAPTEDVAVLNDDLKRLTRILNPPLYTITGPYDMDSALQQPLLPGLAPARTLRTLDQASDDHHFLLTELRRQRNRLEEALREATEVADQFSQ